MSITDDVTETPSGNRVTWSVLHKKDFSMVIPWDGEKFILVGVQRYASNRLSWEFPSGTAPDPAVDLFETAKQELMEEAGVRATQMKELGDFFISNGHSDQKFFLYLATGLTEGERALSEGEEGMEVKRFSCQELCARIADNTIKDTATVAALGFLLANGWLKEKGIV